jgi:hypothetical protein
VKIYVVYVGTKDSLLIFGAVIAFALNFVLAVQVTFKAVRSYRTLSYTEILGRDRESASKWETQKGIIAENVTILRILDELLICELSMISYHLQYTCQINVNLNFKAIDICLRNYIFVAVIITWPAAIEISALILIWCSRKFISYRPACLFNLKVLILRFYMCRSR